MEVKGKFPAVRWKWQIRKDIRQKEETEQQLWEDKCQMEKLSCQMTHLKWKCLRKNNTSVSASSVSAFRRVAVQH